MKCAIVSIGDEVVRGEVQNSNTSYLVHSLVCAGFEPVLTLAASDDFGAIADALSLALEQADLVVTTGGLGPTPDDLTRQAVAHVLGLGFHEDPAIKQWIDERFRKMGMQTPEINYTQAQVIDGAKVLVNQNGTAPGLLIQNDGKTIVLLPGPPREMKPIWEEQVLPALKSEGARCFAKEFFVYGLSESAMAEIIAQELAPNGNVKVAPYASLGEVRLRVWGKATSQTDFDNESQGLIAALKSKLIGHVFENRIEIELGNIFRAKGLTLSCAESCTGGLVAKTITDIAGSSDYFLGGCVCYSNQAKMDVLGVKQETLTDYGAVSEQTALEMALGAKRTFKSDCAISTTGIAGPGGGTPEKPVGLVYMGFAWPGGQKVEKKVFLGARDDVRRRTLMFVLYGMLKNIS